MRAYERQAQVMAPPTPPSEYEEQRLAEQRRDRKLAVLVSVIAGTCLILFSLTQLVPSLTGAWVAAAALLVPFGVMLGWQWQRMRVRQASYVLAKDSRAPVVYLRPFEVDRTARGFEGLIFGSLKDLGPIVAIGRPDEKSPSESRIARAYLTDDQWQDRVSDLIGRARLVVAQIGTSEGLVWELIQAVHLLRPDQLIVCLGGRRHTNLRYQQFREQTSPIFPRGLPDQIQGSGFITFGPDWAPIPSRELKSSEGDYMSWVLQGLHRRLFRSSRR